MLIEDFVVLKCHGVLWLVLCILYCCNSSLRTSLGPSVVCAGICNPVELAFSSDVSAVFDSCLHAFVAEHKQGISAAESVVQERGEWKEFCGSGRGKTLLC